jgi:hypothetical protein
MDRAEVRTVSGVFMQRNLGSISIATAVALSLSAACTAVEEPQPDPRILAADACTFVDVGYPELGDDLVAQFEAAADD